MEKASGGFLLLRLLDRFPVLERRAVEDGPQKVWLNGEVVHANNAVRGLTPGQDKVTVRLREGWNRLVLKVTEDGGDWEACARFRATDGGAIEGLRTRATGW